MSNYLSEGDLNAVKGLMHYLNTNMMPAVAVGIDVTMTDSNGESLGTIAWDSDFGGDGEYVLKFPA